MIDNVTKKNILKKITSSESFKDSDKYSALLTYLVNKTLDGDVPKEYSIAIDFFKRDKDFDPSEDTIVRYYMYRLRQKIAAYYENEGKDDKVWLVIPKGHYEVKFQTKPKAVKSLHKSKRALNYILLILFILAVALSVYLYYRPQVSENRGGLVEDMIPNNDPVWSNFFTNDFPNVVLIGDHLLYQEYDEELKRYRFIIDHKITKRSEYDDFVSGHANRKLIKSDQGSLPLNSVFNLKDLFQVFYSFGKIFDIELSSVFMSSQFDLTNINERNIIYIGGFRNLRKLNYIMDQIGVSFKYSPNDYWRGEINIRQREPDSVFTFKSARLEDNHYSDIGFIAKVPGNKKENYLILTGFAYPAQIEVVRLISHNTGLSRIYEQTKEQYTTFPPYFFMVIEVTSLEYSALESKIIYFKKIKTE